MTSSSSQEKFLCSNVTTCGNIATPTTFADLDHRLKVSKTPVQSHTHLKSLYLDQISSGRNLSQWQLGAVPRHRFVSQSGPVVKDQSGGGQRVFSMRILCCDR